MSDIRNLISTVLQFTKSKISPICYGPLDGFVLRMHYRWTFRLYLLCFTIVYYNWFFAEKIVCVSKYSAPERVNSHHLNLCLSYPFTVDAFGEKTYYHWYKFLHWIVLFLAGLCYVPRKLSKVMTNLKYQSFFEEVAKHKGELKNFTKGYFEAREYLRYHLNRFGRTYSQHLFLNFLALVIDIYSIIYLDCSLHRTFIPYGLLAYPYKNMFVDYAGGVPGAYPWFVECVIGPRHALLAKRTEKYGCYLPLMEFYDKFFLVLWFWYVILLCCTIVYITALILINLPPVKAYVLKPSYWEELDPHQTIVKVVNKCNVDDVYVLYRIRQLLPAKAYGRLITDIAREDFKISKHSRPLNEILECKQDMFEKGI